MTSRLRFLSLSSSAALFPPIFAADMRALLLSADSDARVPRSHASDMSPVRHKDPSAKRHFRSVAACAEGKAYRAPPFSAHTRREPPGPSGKEVHIERLHIRGRNDISVTLQIFLVFSVSLIFFLYLNMCCLLSFSFSLFYFHSSSSSVIFFFLLLYSSSFFFRIQIFFSFYSSFR